MEDIYDLLFVGAGISTTYTLIHLLEAEFKRPVRLLKIAVVERNDTVYTGMPYGRLSSKSSLIITPLGDFLPEEERAPFISWLGNHRERLLERFRLEVASGNSRENRVAAEWLANSHTYITGGQWNEVCLPRHWFGEYITERVENLISLAGHSNRARVDVIRAEASGLSRRPDAIFGLEYYPSGEHIGEKRVVLGRQVVLSLGSPPQRMLENSTGDTIVEDAYKEGFNATLDHVLGRLENEVNAEHRNVLVVGTNASALELIYHLRLHDEVYNRIFLLSTDASLPQLIGKINPDLSIPSENLDQLGQSLPVDADSLYRALELDAFAAMKAGYNITDLNKQLTRKMAGFLYAMPENEQFKYFDAYGMKTTKIMRRAGTEYRKPVDALLQSGRLVLLAGRYTGSTTDPDGKVNIQYRDRDGNIVQLEEHHFSSIINCTGSLLMDETGSSLIASLYQTHLAKPTGNRLGLVVNEQMECSENLYVMGPLLAGNINRVVNSWHVESAWRISLLSKELANVIASRA